MGLCASCVNQTPNRCYEQTCSSSSKCKQRPFLFDLEAAFLQHSGSDKLLNRTELARIWKDSARKKKGKLTPQEEQLIETSSKELFHELDADNSGKISYSEFIAHSLGGFETRGALRGLREHLQAHLKENPKGLSEFLDRFMKWDKNGDGYVTEAELDDYVKSLTQSSELDSNLAKRVKHELFEIADVNQDGQVDLWELCAWALGRRKTPVELLLYDISKGATKWAGPLLLGRSDVEAFHSSLLVFQSEYWYGGRIFRSDPPCDKQFGPPLTTSSALKLEPSESVPDLHVVRLGYTLVTHEEFVEFLKDKMTPRYTGVEKYDLLTRSCNHFADECLHFLLGRGLPEHVFELQRMALTPALRSLRPFLNRYLGGFSEEDGGGDPLLDDHKVLHRVGKFDPKGLLGEGAIVLLDGGAAGIDEAGSTVVATVEKESEGTVDVKFWSPLEGKVNTVSRVPVTSILKRVE